VRVRLELDHPIGSASKRITQEDCFSRHHPDPASRHPRHGFLLRILYNLPQILYSQSVRNLPCVNLNEHAIHLHAEYAFI
jgi:hypothetical protein